MLKAEIIQTVIALDPSRKVEDLEEMKVAELTALVEILNDAPEGEEEDETKVDVVEEKEAPKRGIFVSSGCSISAKGRVFGPGSAIEDGILPEESIARLLEKGKLTKV